MVKQTFNTMGLDFQLEVPVDIAEFDKLAGAPGAALREAILNVVYRSTLPDVRARFITGIEKATGINFPTVEVKSKDAAGKETTEVVYDPKVSDGAFIKSVRAKKGWDDPSLWASNATPILLASLKGDPKATDEGDKLDVVFDPKATAKGPAKPKKLPEVYLQASARVFQNGNQDKIAARIKTESDGTVLVTYVPLPALKKGHKESEEAHAKALATNVEALGWAIRANELYLAKKKTESYA